MTQQEIKDLQDKVALLTKDVEQKKRDLRNFLLKGIVFLIALAAMIWLNCFIIAHLWHIVITPMGGHDISLKVAYGVATIVAACTGSRIATQEKVDFWKIMKYFLTEAIGLFAAWGLLHWLFS